MTSKAVSLDVGTASSYMEFAIQLRSVQTVHQRCAASPILRVLHNIDHAAVAPSCHPTSTAQSLLGAYLLHQLLLHVIVLPRQVLQLLSRFLHGPVGELGAILASLQQHVLGLQLLPHYLLFLHTIMSSIIQSYPTIVPLTIIIITINDVNSNNNNNNNNNNNALQLMVS